MPVVIQVRCGNSNHPANRGRRGHPGVGQPLGRVTLPDGATPDQQAAYDTALVCSDCTDATIAARGKWRIAKNKHDADPTAPDPGPEPTLLDSDD